MIVFTHSPAGFDLKFEIAVLYGEQKGKFLFLLRQDHETAPNKWCLPGGGIHRDETPQQCLIREVREETALDLITEKVIACRKFFVRDPNVGDFLIHPFYYQFVNLPAVNINAEEHKDFVWASVEAALKMDLVEGGAEQLKIFQSQEWPVIQKKQ